MGSNSINNFIEEVVSQVKFKFDRDDISEELRSHILDSKEYYEGKGMSEKEAIDLAVNNMGNPIEIGIDLNKEHSPILGWIYIISEFIKFFIVILLAISILINIISFIFNGFSNIERKMDKSNIVYEQEVDETRTIDKRKITVKKIFIDKDDYLTILFKDSEPFFEKGGWGFSYSRIKVMDDLGNEYGNASGYGSSNESVNTYEEKIDSKASKIILDFNEGDRKFRIEIPLENGEIYE